MFQITGSRFQMDIDKNGVKKRGEEGGRTSSNRLLGLVELSNGSEDEEDGSGSGSVVDGSRGVGSRDSSSKASVDVELVV